MEETFGAGLGEKCMTGRDRQDRQVEINMIMP